MRLVVVCLRADRSADRAFGVATVQSKFENRKMRNVKKSKTFGRKRSKPYRFYVSKFEIAKLELRDGDMVVLRTDLLLTREQVMEIRARAIEQFPGVHVAILTAGMSLAVLSDKRTEKGTA